MKPEHCAPKHTTRYLASVYEMIWKGVNMGTLSASPIMAVGWRLLEKQTHILMQGGLIAFDHQQIVTRRGENARTDRRVSVQGIRAQHTSFDIQRTQEFLHAGRVHSPSPAPPAL